MNFSQIERVSGMTIEPKQKVENVDKNVQVGTPYNQYKDKEIQVGIQETQQSKTKESKMEQFIKRSIRTSKKIEQAKKQ